MMGKKKKQQRAPLSGTILPAVGPRPAVTSQSLVPLRAASQQTQTALPLWALRAPAGISAPRLPAKPVPWYSPPQRGTQGLHRDLALGRVQVQRSLRVGGRSFGFEYSNTWAPRRMDVTLPNGISVHIDGLTSSECRDLLMLAIAATSGWGRAA
jgi:hypothetical protein